MRFPIYSLDMCMCTSSIFYVCLHLISSNWKGGNEDWLNKEIVQRQKTSPKLQLVWMPGG